MFLMSRDVTRQLSNIYKLNFKKKYIKEIKERLELYISNSYGVLSLNELKAVETEIEINKNEISILKEEFFLKHKIPLLNFFNENWYSNETEYKATKKEEEYFVNYILEATCYNSLEKIKTIYPLLKKISSSRILIELESRFYINRLIENITFVERKKDYKSALQIIKGLLNYENGNIKTVKYLYTDEDFEVLKNKIKNNYKDSLLQLKSLKSFKSIANIVIYELMIEELELKLNS